MSRYDREAAAEESIRQDKRRGFVTPKLDPAAFWATVDLHETTPCGPDGDACDGADDRPYRCKAHREILYGPDEPDEEPFQHLYGCDVYRTQWCVCPPMSERPVCDDFRSDDEKRADYLANRADDEYHERGPR